MIRFKMLSIQQHLKKIRKKEREKERKNERKKYNSDNC